MKNDVPNNSCIVTCIRCRVNVSTQPLPSTECRDTHTDAHTDERIYELRVEMGSVAVIYVPSFIKIGSGIQKLVDGIHKHAERMEIA
jgi:hypothetical protein